MRLHRTLLVIGLAACAAPGVSEQELIKELGHPDPAIRDDAEAALGRLLPRVEGLLRIHSNSSDGEIAARCRQLLERLPRQPDPVLMPQETPRLLFLWEPRGTSGSPATYRVALVDKRRGVALDLRRKGGASPGDRFSVSRDGATVGLLVIREVNSWGSWADPAEGTTLDQLKRGDVAERVSDP